MSRLKGRKALVIFAGLILLFYFVSVLYLVPGLYSEKSRDVPSPLFDVSLSNSTVRLGESFRIDVVSENVGDYGDIHIVSVGFPNMTGIDSTYVRVVSYNFTHAPHFIEINDEVGAGYTGGTQTVHAKYPSIEAVSRPAVPGEKYQMGVIVTPVASGNFTVYVKSVDIPHLSDVSHFPKTGIKDYQDEFVKAYNVAVVP